MLVSVMVHIRVGRLSVTQFIAWVPQKPTLAQLRVRGIAYWSFGDHSTSVTHWGQRTGNKIYMQLLFRDTKYPNGEFIYIFNIIGL